MGKTEENIFHDIQGVVKLVEFGEKVTIKVVGRSMTPTFIHLKDTITLAPFEDDDLQAGAVVLFRRSDGHLCVHRIIQRKGRNLVIRGDGNALNALEYATVDDVKALVVGGTFRNGRRFGIYDAKWENNTAFILKHPHLVAIWNRTVGILKNYWLAILTSLLLLYLSFFDPRGMKMPEVPGKDKGVHTLMYFVITMVYWFEWMKSHPLTRRSLFRGLLPCLLFPIIIGGLTEIGQGMLTEYRSADWGDFAANVTGVFAALLFSVTVTYSLLKLYRKYKHTGK